MKAAGEIMTYTLVGDVDSQSSRLLTGWSNATGDCYCIMKLTLRYFRSRCIALHWWFQIASISSDPESTWLQRHKTNSWCRMPVIFFYFTFNNRSDFKTALKAKRFSDCSSPRKIDGSRETCSMTASSAWRIISMTASSAWLHHLHDCIRITGHRIGERLTRGDNVVR